jgi:hypothetical protein
VGLYGPAFLWNQEEEGMKEEILRLMKEQLRAVIENINYENYRDMEGQIFRVFTIIETAETMMDSPRPVHPLLEPTKEEGVGLPPLIKQILESCPEDDTMTMEQLLAEEEAEKELDERKAYRFERKIKGGIVPDIDAFVPEKIIWELDLCHGDKVYAHFLFKPENGPTRYEYELAEKADPPCEPENIIPIHMGIVSYEPRVGGLAICKTVNEGDLVHEGERLCLKLNDQDIDDMSLRDGDIVNAAFYENNPDYIRVRWKFNDTEYQTEQSIERRASAYSRKKETTKKEYEQIFKGKTIACMGYEPGWADFTEEVERRGGEFVGITGRETRDTLASALKRSDCLIMTIGHVGHGGTQWAVPYCKVNHVPYGDIRTFGRSTFVNKAIELLQK